MSAYQPKRQIVSLTGSAVITHDIVYRAVILKYEKDSFSRKGVHFTKRILLSRKGAGCVGSGRFHGNYLSL